MERSLFVTAEVSRMIGVSIDRIIRAHRNGLAEPARAGHHRIYTVEEVEMIRQHFAGAKDTRDSVRN